MKKSITELTDEELLKLANNKIEENLFFRNDVTEFLSYYGLKAGTYRIPSKLLYKIYKSWSPSPITQKTFTETLTDLFPSVRYGKGIVICLNKSAFNLKSLLETYFQTTHKTKSKKWKQHFDKYLEKYTLKKGTLHIKESLLYNLYDKWTYKNKNKHPLGPEQFRNFCKIYFKYKIIHGDYYFTLNESIKDHLTEEMLQNMKVTNVKKENQTSNS